MQRQLQVNKSDTSVVLTFLNPPEHKGYKPTFTESRLAQIQKDTHSGVAQENYIRALSGDNGKDPLLKKQEYTVYNSGVASMLHYAFKEHLPVTLSPDDIHLLVVQGFNRFVQMYPEDFRNALVSFQGKKDLLVRNDMLSDIDPESWDVVPAGFASLIREEVPPAVVDLMLQDYSQTTKIERQVKAVTLMGTFSSYFNYTVSTMCFIPEFVLKGTEQDWEKVAQIPHQLIKLLNLSARQGNEAEKGTHLLHRWLTRLMPILDEFYRARCGKADPNFWEEFYKNKDSSGTARLSGRIVYFYPFLYEKRGDNIVPNKYILNNWIMGDQVTLGARDSDYNYDGPATILLPANIVEVDFKWNDLGDVYEMGMKAGIFAHFIDNANRRMLSTYTDWTIFYKNRQPVATGVYDPFMAEEEPVTAAPAPVSTASEIPSAPVTARVERKPDPEPEVKEQQIIAPKPVSATSQPQSSEKNVADVAQMREILREKEREVRRMRAMLSSSSQPTVSRQGVFGQTEARKPDDSPAKAAQHRL